MPSFSLSPSLTKNKAFLLQKSDLLDRWDPLMILYQRENQSFKYETKKLKQLLVSNPEYGAGEIGIERKTETEPRYIRITDIDEFGLLSSDLGVTANSIEVKYFLNDNDFLFARSGATVGKAYLHKKDLVPYPCFYAGYMIRYRLNDKEIIPEYLFAITQTRFYKNWVKAIQRPTGQPNINAEEFKSLSFPLPPKAIQQKIVNIFLRAYEQKKQNEAQAERLLASIDDYLLKELGITLPEPPDNCLKNRVFVTSIKEITGGRLDAYYYQKSFLNLENAISTGEFKTKRLSTLTQKIINGIDVRDFTDTGLRYLRVSNVKPNCIDTVEIKLIPSYIIAKDIHLAPGDLLITRKGTFGVCAPVMSDVEDCVISSEIFRLPIDKEHADVWYLSYFLNSVIGKMLFDRIKTGAIMGHITQDVLASIKVPIPTLAKQKEIADYITKIREQAQSLKDKTKEDLVKANRDIEKILLG